MLWKTVFIFIVSSALLVHGKYAKNHKHKQDSPSNSLETQMEPSESSHFNHYLYKQLLAEKAQKERERLRKIARQIYLQIKNGCQKDMCLNKNCRKNIFK